MGKRGSPPHTTTAAITTELQDNYHPEPSENQAVVKSDNQGIKEATFIQIGRSGVDTKQAGPTPACGG